MHKGREGAGTAPTIIAPTRAGNSNWEVPGASGSSRGSSDLQGISPLADGKTPPWQHLWAPEKGFMEKGFLWDIPIFMPNSQFLIQEGNEELMFGAAHSKFLLNSTFQLGMRLWTPRDWNRNNSKDKVAPCCYFSNLCFSL